MLMYGDLLLFVCIFNSDREAAVYLSYNSLRSTLNNVRRQIRPPQPFDFRLVGDIVQNQAQYADIYFGAVHDGEETAVILTTAELLQGLNMSRECLIDGTFAVYFTYIKHITLNKNFCTLINNI